MKPFSLDLRQRIANAVEAGESKASASRRFKVSYSTVRNFLKLDALGSLEPRKNEKPAGRKFTPDALDALKAWLKKNDLALKQIRKRLRAGFRIQASQSSIGDRLAAMDLSWKKQPTPPGGSARASGRIGKDGRRKWAIRRPGVR